ncbi:retrovirus-related Pol polyprotein from transposon 17.6 [Caerostris darwini]|uniref:Retrovirus-related Pol polyprotein from transposon 17.6 n=1 Tax=Caerostris darwini TaxID=1538125 RepID=A0AAV4RSW2_9ARAC|nr:retrovirus-related Pol polyprotein from transposon 17.6 [Caerostris darwini]
MKVANLIELIKSSPLFKDRDFIISLVKNNATNEEKLRQEALKEKRRQGKNALKEKRRANESQLEELKMEMHFELEKLKLQASDSIGEVVDNVVWSSTYSENKIDVQKWLPTFMTEIDDINPFLVLLKRQLKLSKISEHLWVSHLLNVVLNSISILIVSESEENSSNFAFVEELLLKCFKINAEKFKQLFFAHRKQKENTGVIRCIAGELMYNLFKENGTSLKTRTLDGTLADGITQSRETLLTIVTVTIEDQDKTAFGCPYGIFRYLKMSFGLRRAPATFQRLIDKFKRDLNNILALFYLDDIIALYDTFENHVSIFRDTEYQES